MRAPLSSPAALPPPGELSHLVRARLVAEILSAYVLLAPRVRSNDLRAMARQARRMSWSGSRRACPEPEATAVRLGQMVRAVLSALPTDDRCLIRSLVLLRMLARRGVPTELVVGVSHEGGFSAHAWIEHEGWAVLPTLGMQPLTRL